MSMPSTISIGLSRSAIELKQFFRERETLIFTFLFPSILLLLIGSTFNEPMGDLGVKSGQVLAASIAAAAIASTSFVTLSAGIAVDRDNGTLKRLRGMPMPPVAFFLGRVVQVLVASVAALVLALAVGVIHFDLVLPTDPGKWLTLGWLYLLGVTACALLGIAISSLARTASSASAISILPFTVLQFISGVYLVPVTVVPTPLREIGSFFPLKWLAQGFRSVFLPDRAAALETSGAWDLGLIAIVLVAWCVAGLVLCLTTFRWRGRLTR